MILRKFNRLDFYDIGEEQRELIKDSLTYDNPKYLQAKRFSGYKNIKIPPYLTYYEEYTDSLGQRVLSVPIGYNYKEILGEDIRNFKITDSREEHKVIYPDFLFDLRHDQKVAEESYFDEINNNSEFPRCLIQLSTGKGKAQPLYTKILTPKGFKKMVDIEVGDYVIGRDGKKTKVIGVYPQGIKPVYEITFKDGTKTRCSDEHLWWYRELGDKRLDRDFKIATLKEIMTKPLKVGRAFNLSIPKNKPIKDFENKVLPLDSYALGCLLGDGCLVTLNSDKQSSCYFSSTEGDIIERLNTSIKSFGEFILNPHTQCQYVFRCVGGTKNSKFREVLNDLGVCVKSGEKFIPNSYLFASKEDRFALLQGLFDTDGCVVPNGSFTFTTSSKQLSEDIAFLCRSLGYRALITSRNRVGKTYKTYGKEYIRKSLEYTIRIQTHDNIFTSKKHLEKDIEACGKHRKQESYRDLIITNIQYVGEEECQCIMVDNEDHTYICDDFVVTHNTVLALHIAFRLSVKTLVLVHKDDLVVGWKKDIEKAFGGKIDTGLIKAKSRKVGEQITIATVQTLSRMSEEELSQYTSQFGLVVMDECHRVGINIFNVIDKFGSKYKLGLSATPIRSDGLDFVFKLFFGGIGYKHIIEEGDEDICNCEVRKIKSNYVYKPFVVGNQIFNEEDFKGNMPKEFTYLEDIPYKKRPRLMYSTVDNLSVMSNKTKVVVCKKIIEHFREGHSIIAFFNQKEHINIYYRYLSRYIPSEKIALYYGDSKESSQSLMEKAESKEVLITLATYAKATEGTNVKSWEVAFLVSSLNNRKNLEQATGRIRRKKEGKLNPAIVYDVVYDKCYSLQSHYHTREGVYDRLKYIIKDKHKKGLFQRGYQGRS